MIIPDIIRNPAATTEQLHQAGVYVYDNSERQFVGHMSDYTLRRVTHKIAIAAMDKEDDIARNGYGLLGTVRGEMAYDMIESEIEQAGNGQLFRQFVESHPLWYHLVGEHKRRGLAFPYCRI